MTKPPEISDKSGNECAIDDINPSHPGWEIILNFENREDDVALEDFKILQEMVTYGLAALDFNHETKTVFLSAVKGCREAKIPVKYLELMDRYEPRATTTKDSNLPPTAKAPPISSAPLVEQMIESARNLHVAIGTTTTPPPPPVTDTPAPPAQRFETVPPPSDDLIVIKLRHRLSDDELKDLQRKTGCDNFKAIRLKLKEIAQKFNWEFHCIFEADADIIKLRKKTGAQKSRPLDAKSAEFVMNSQI